MNQTPQIKLIYFMTMRTPHSTTQNKAITLRSEKVIPSRTRVPSVPKNVNQEAEDKHQEGENTSNIIGEAMVESRTMKDKTNPWCTQATSEMNTFELKSSVVNHFPKFDGN